MDRPVPGPTDVLVRVDAAAVDPVDMFVRSGAYRTPTPFPFVLGRDLVGTVAETGPGATGFAVGDRVWSHSMGHGGRQGVTAEYCVVGVDRLYHLPGDVDAARAVAVLHPVATAHLALFRHARLQPGETVLVIGGAGNVGRAATVLAARAGARVLAVARAETAPDCLRPAPRPWSTTATPTPPSSFVSSSAPAWTSTSTRPGTRTSTPPWPWSGTVPASC